VAGGEAETGVDRALDDAINQGNGPRPPDQVLDHSGQYPGQAAGQGEVTGQSGPAGDQRHGGHGRDGGQRAELHHRQLWPT
jgi:hypothetical protein